MARQTNELMADLGVKSTAEICLDKLNSKTEYLGKSFQAINLFTSELTAKIDGIKVKLVAMIDGAAGQIVTTKSILQ